MPAKKSAKSKNGNGVNLGIENELWEAADKLRGHLDAAEYKSVVLGMSIQAIRIRISSWIRTN